MIMSEEFRNEIRLENKLGNREKAFKMLQEYRRECYPYLERGQDKFFLDYCLCHHYMVDYKNEFMAKTYLNCIKEMFESGIESESEDDYYKFLWMNVNLNGEEISKHKIIEDMTIVYKYFLKAEQINIAINAKETILFYCNDEEGMLNCLKQLANQGVSDKNFINSILRNCKKISSNLYIRALQMLKECNYDTEELIFKVS